MLFAKYLLWGHMVLKIKEKGLRKMFLLSSEKGLLLKERICHETN